MWKRNKIGEYMFGLFKNKCKEENEELKAVNERLKDSNERLHVTLQLVNCAVDSERARALVLEATVATLEKSLAEASLEVESLLALIRVLEAPKSKPRKVSKKAKSKR